MSTGLQICGLVAGVLSWCLQSSCTSSQLWKVRSQAESLSTSQWQYEGLWMSCAATSLGSLQCNKFKTLLGLPVHVQVCRALMMSSLVVGLAAIIVSILGLKCSKVGGGSPQVKGQFLLSGGVMLILSGERTRGANVSTPVAVCLTVRLSFCTGDEGVHDDDYGDANTDDDGDLRPLQVRAGHGSLPGLGRFRSGADGRCNALLLLQGELFLIIILPKCKTVVVQLLQKQSRS
ncbi:claudin-7-like isoform 1-T1 [Syngnathus typhle]